MDEGHKARKCSNEQLTYSIPIKDFLPGLELLWGASEKLRDLKHTLQLLSMKWNRHLMSSWVVDTAKGAARSQG